MCCSSGAAFHTARWAARGAALDGDACGPEKQPALQGGSPGGSAGGLGPARRGRLGSQNTKTRAALAATLRLVGVLERLSTRGRTPLGSTSFFKKSNSGFVALDFQFLSSYDAPTRSKARSNTSVHLLIGSHRVLPTTYTARCRNKLYTDCTPKF